MSDIMLLSPLLTGGLIYMLSFWKTSDKRKEMVASSLAMLGSLFSLVFALMGLQKRGVEDSILGSWIKIGTVDIKLQYYFDGWSITLTVVSSLLTLLIIIFSKYYFGVNSHSAVYYGMIQIFLFGMLLLVVSDNLVFTFFGWEIVGICSWFLIGLYHYEGGEKGEKAILSGQKAILVTGLADIGFLLALAIVGSDSFSISNMENMPAIAAIGLTIAAFGKSAQFPFHVWISSTDRKDIDAMQGPTTVSALIHAATMVNAGIYLVSRVMEITTTVSELVLWVGIVSTIFAGISALGTIDLKRVLAYSTISQLGFMFIALGSGASFLALWHLLNHAFFKALLFLIAGFLIHRYKSRNLEDLKGTVRETWLKASLFTGIFALAGVPFFSGFFSKEMILEAVHGKSTIAFYFSLFGSILTSIYSFRLLAVLNGSKEKKPSNIIPKAIILALTALVILSSASYYFLGLFNWDTVYPVVELNGNLGIGIIVSVMGMALGYYFEQWYPKLPLFVRVPVQDAFFVDDLLTATGKSLTITMSRFARTLNSQTSFWNMFQFSIVISVVSIGLYYLQYGGGL